MPNPFFSFKQFTIHHDRCAMKVTTDGCLFGAWVADAIQNLGFRISDAVDIGSGSGLLSLMVAQKNMLEIDAVEIDIEAATQAMQNVNDSPFSTQIYVHHNDILSFESPKKYDCIFSNPPFYEREIRSSLPVKNTAHHSDALSMKQLLSMIKKHLNDAGIFFLLLPHKRRKEIEKMLPDAGLFPEHIVTVKQSIRHAPFRLMIKGSLKKKKLVEEELSICDENQNYAPEFVALLKDYYLYL